jgi:hypothetical protein
MCGALPPPPLYTIMAWCLATSITKPLHLPHPVLLIQTLLLYLKVNCKVQSLAAEILLLVKYMPTMQNVADIQRKEFY